MTYLYTLPFISVMEEYPGYAVLPPGHGKSRYHDAYMGFLDAETMVGCESTEELRMLREEAKESGCWGAYNKIWCGMLMDIDPYFNGVWLVRSKEIGEMLGARFVFRGALEVGQWERNLENHKSDVNKYKHYWDEVVADGAKIYLTNNDLHRELYDACVRYMISSEDLSVVEGLDVYD